MDVKITSEIDVPVYFIRASFMVSKLTVDEEDVVPDMMI